MSSSGYIAEVLNLPFNTTEQDLQDFFSFCGTIEHVEILRAGEYASSAYIKFREPHALDTAVLVTGAKMGDSCVCIMRYDQNENGSGIWNRQSWESEYEMHADQFLVSPSEAVTLTQEAVKKGYVLGKDASYRAFDGSYKVSALAAGKVADMRNRIGLTQKISAGVGVVKSVDKKCHISDATKYVAKTVVCSSYFSKGALWASDALSKAAKVAADLGRHGQSKNKKIW